MLQRAWVRNFQFQVEALSTRIDGSWRKCGSEVRILDVMLGRWESASGKRVLKIR